MNILLAIDDSPCSTAAVLALRDRYQAQDAVVRVLHVLEWPRSLPLSLAFAEGPHAAESVLAAHNDLRRSAETLVSRAAALLRAAGFDATSCIVEGEPRRTILEMAAQWPANTIVLGSHGRRGVDRLLPGSVSGSVVRHARCSVAVIREQNRNLVGQTPSSCRCV
jgi:nucleotide-binding universal stress UspA family protein